MAGETDLAQLLQTMEPTLHPDEFVYCTTPDNSSLDSLCAFREAEGVTLICPRTEAERRSIPFTFPCRMITLAVHSSLEAVGFLAEVSSALARNGIGVNVISGYYHDHLFVRTEDAARTLSVLQQLQRAARL